MHFKSPSMLDYFEQAVVRITHVPVISIEPRAVVSPVKPRGTAAFSPFAVFALLFQPYNPKSYVSQLYFMTICNNIRRSKRACSPAFLC